MNKKCAIIYSSLTPSSIICDDTDLNVPTSIRDALVSLGWDVTSYNLKNGGFKSCAENNKETKYQFVMLFHAGTIDVPDLKFWNKHYYPDTVMLAEGGDEWQCFNYNFPHNRLADCVISPDCDAVNAYKQNGVNAEWMTHWADERVYHNSTNIPILERKFDFVTTAVHTQVRDARGYRRILDILSSAGIKIYNPTVERAGYISQQENGDLYRNAKFVFQFSSQGEITRRIFEAAACGCIVFTDKLAESKSLAKIFPDNSIILYDSIPSIVEAYNHFNNDPEYAQKTANIGNKVVLNNHLAIHRAESIVQCYLRYKNESK